MPDEVYKQLLEIMKSRRGSYAGMDIPEFFTMVEELFTSEEATVNNLLTRKPATAIEVAEQMGREGSEIEVILEAMADKGLCVAYQREGITCYQGAPFMPGIFEYQFMPGKESDRDKKIARLIWDYKKAFNSAKDAVPMTYPVTRVITVDRTIDAGNTINTYDQVATYIEKYDAIGVGACYCRHAAKLRGEDVHGMPTEVCMSFGKGAEYAVERLGARKLGKEEALKILDQTEEAGLVHMTRNTTEDIEFICNCDRWHCEAISSVMKQPKPALYFNSGYQPKFDSDLCVACGTCIDRCPPEALTMGTDDIPELNLDLCFGCAVCATGCPEDAIMMAAKPDFEVPPKDMKELVTALKASREG